ncbi:GNAT family N-acetyltransferase [Aestuariicella hydrocarbonica]|uniref:GNAT family N-acetyltransferase n=1 Tax=Pseudomaricurvus hydrocarbonicus TaxID=1470433 RepID=A0A9E5MK09_9GAMM|nr:GNAT family N-acetyltransferase [Aestuariicella hydrocarbonica]NHO64732.1 GNAT family N-acetyltransferase [Aestuariicella hydrocarbonica]
MYQLERLSDLQIPLINKFYKQCRYSSKAGRGEVLYVLKGAAGIVAAVRLEPKSDGWYFLRAMCVAPELRGQGVGTQLLQGLVSFLRENPCYCYPFQHLESFYAQVGFQSKDPQQAPAFMSEAFQRYTQQGRKIILMERLAG